jgi:hypothetical protein
MKPQNINNHRRLLPLYHGVTLFSILALLVGSLVNLSKSAGDENKVYSASLICLIALILLSMFFFARIFGLRAQDRAIRAEQNLRHYVLTGKLLPSSLHIRQVIALRFASDEEFVALAAKAARENLSPGAIKRAIQSWQGDYHRV